MHRHRRTRHRCVGDYSLATIFGPSFSTPAWIRTRDLRIRSPLLYPAELPGLVPASAGGQMIPSRADAGARCRTSTPREGQNHAAAWSHGPMPNSRTLILSAALAASALAPVTALAATADRSRSYAARHRCGSSTRIMPSSTSPRSACRSRGRQAQREDHVRQRRAGLGPEGQRQARLRHGVRRHGLLHARDGQPRHVHGHVPARDVQAGHPHREAVRGRRGAARPSPRPLDARAGSRKRSGPRQRALRRSLIVRAFEESCNSRRFTGPDARACRLTIEGTQDMREAPRRHGDDRRHGRGADAGKRTRASFGLPQQARVSVGPRVIQMARQAVREAVLAEAHERVQAEDAVRGADVLLQVVAFARGEDHAHPCRAARGGGADSCRRHRCDMRELQHARRRSARR